MWAFMKSITSIYTDILLKCMYYKTKYAFLHSCIIYIYHLKFYLHLAKVVSLQNIEKGQDLIKRNSLTSHY